MLRWPREGGSHKVVTITVIPPTHQQCVSCRIVIVVITAVRRVSVEASRS